MNIKKIQDAHLRIRDYVSQTPLTLADWLNAPVYFKCENNHVTKSFKERGAFNALLQLTDEEKKRGVITRSSGNFAQAVARAGKELGISVKVVMPLHVPLVKKKRVEDFGAEVYLCGHEHVEAQNLVDELAKTGALTKLHPFDNEDVIYGQGTCGLEIVEKLPDVQTLYVPVSGGGLSAGICLAIKAHNPTVKIIGVEPMGASDLSRSLEKGAVQSLNHPKSICDGLLAPRVGLHNWPILKKYLDSVVVVEDSEVESAMKLIFENSNLVIEPSGAASVAAYLKKRTRESGPFVCILSGGNVDREKFPHIFEH